MWPFRKRQQITDADVMRLLTKQHARLEVLEESLARLEGQHKSLRGRVYQKWRLSDPEGTPSTGAATPDVSATNVFPANASKEEIRRILGRSGKLVAGRPTHHES